MATIPNYQRLEQITDYIKRNPWSTSRDAAESLGLAQSSITSSILAIETSGMALFMVDERDKKLIYSIYKDEFDSSVMFTE